MKKRVLSCLMALALCLTLLPAATASAYYDDYYDGYYGSGHTHYLCGVGSSSYDYAPGSCTCSPEENAKTNFTTELKQGDGTLTKGGAAWSATDSNYVLEDGKYYLASNLTLDRGILITGNVTLCLNGYSIICNAGADTSNPVPVIKVSENQSFTLTNCRSQTYWDYKITHTEGKYGCGVYNEGIFNMYGGTISGNSAAQGGGVYNKRIFNLYGGTISDNKAVGNVSSSFNDGEGGGVCNGDPLTVDTTAAFTMSGGTISGNTACYGGGVYNKGTFELSGGTISGNSAAQGGGVYSYGRGTTFTMSGGVIGGTKENSVNTAEYYGGGVSNQSDSKFTMSGGLIAGNKVTASNIGAGGGVFNNATFTMSGGKIGGSEAGKNTSANLGGGVYTSGTFTMSGSAEVSYNTAASKGGGVYNNCSTFSLTDGSITNNTAATGGGVYCDRSDTKPGNVTLSGNARIANNHAGDANSNLYLLENGTVAANGLSADAGIGVSTAVDVAGSQRNVQVTSDTVSANYFTSDNTTYITQIAESNGTGYVVLTQRSASTTHDHSCVCGATHIHSNGHDTEKNLTNWVGISDLNLITGAGNYYLTDNVTLTEATAYDSGSYYGWKVPNGVVLCLNGKNIIMRNPDDLVYESGNAKNADAILVTGRFTLTDCMSTQGKITHETNKMGRGITVLGGTFDMYGGQITGNTTTEYGTGGGVRVEGAEDAASSTTFNLYGGSINGNQSGYGGGVYVSRVVWEGASQFNMYGGSISGNTSTVTDETSSYGIGGGVCVSWTAAFKMTGGSITDNTAKFDGAGVYLSALAKSYANETGEQRTAKFEVSGSPNITGNKVNNADNNVYLDTDTQTNTYSGFTNTVDASITILEGLSDNAKIGVTAKEAPTQGNRVLAATGATPNKDYKNIFTSDNTTYEVQNRNDGTLRLAVNGDSSADSSHVHSWIYAIKEGTTNTIVATCNAAGCPNPNGGSVTITAPEHKTYDDGKEAAATVMSTLNSSISTPNIMYQQGDAVPNNEAPTDAGEYKASIKVGGETASVVYTIAPKSVTDPTIEVASGSTYDGTEQKPAVTVKDGTTVIDSNEYTVEYSDNTNACTATVTIKDNDGGNYTLSEKQQTFTIAQRSITEAAASSIADQTYTGSQIKPDVTLTYNGKTLVKDTDYTLTYGDNMTVGSNSGSITFTAKDGGNYTGSKTVNFNIVAKPGLVTISGNLNVTYGTPVPDVAIDKNGSTGDTTVYYYTASDCSAGETTTKPTTAGDYWVKVKMAAAGNYDAAESNVIGFTISQANITPVVSITGWAYKDSANAPSVTGNTGNGSVTYAYKVQSAGDDTYSNTVPTAAGDYTVKATVAETTNYNGGSATANFTISPKDISGVTIAAIDAQTYNNGTAITPTPAVKDGDTTLTVGTDFTYGYENNINAGDAAVVKVLGQGNYTGTASKNFTISRADLPITVNITGWVVGGTPNAPSVNGNTGNGTVTYQYKVKGADDSTYTAAVPTAVGDYTVKATVAQTTNYNAASATTDFSISTKAVQTITAENVTVTYGDSDQAVSGTTSGDGTISYTVKSGAEFVEVNSSTGALTIKKVGTATITVSAAETASYAAASKDITVTVNPLAVTAPATDTTVFTYNGQNQTYGVTETANYTVSNGIQKNAGNYTVTVALKDQVNTVWADSNNTTDKTFGFEIKKATITIAAKNKSAYVNDTAPALGEGDYTVSGLVTGESLKTLPAIAYASTPDMTKAGTVSITVSGAEAPDGGNYNDIIYNNGTLTISTRPSSGGGSYTPPTYKVESEVTESTDGNVSFSKGNAKKGDTVTITVTPDRYYKVDSVTVKDKNGNEIDVIDNGDGTFSFKMPASEVAVEPTFSWDNPFTDVAEDTYYTPAVEWALKNDVTNGTGAGSTFSPNVSCTRAQIVTFLWRAANCPEPTGTQKFDDVVAGSYYEKAIAWAVENGITDGTGNGLFSPDAICTRAQAVTFLFRSKGITASGSDIEFEDVAPDAYYADAVAWALEMGITNGVESNLFAPNNTCTRAQIITFLYRNRDVDDKN